MGVEGLGFFEVTFLEASGCLYCCQSEAEGVCGEISLVAFLLESDGFMRHFGSESFSIKADLLHDGPCHLAVIDQAWRTITNEWKPMDLL